MVIFYKKWKKYDEIQSTKNKMDLNIQKRTNHPLSPDDYSYQRLFYKWTVYGKSPSITADPNTVQN